ncbi:MAG: cytochrome c, partial [Gammaproteobacteria bacterium]|nr:cytochrome c [Gammaproteobacteria bacterium]
MRAALKIKYIIKYSYEKLKKMNSKNSLLTLLAIFVSLLVTGCDKPNPEETRKRAFLPPIGFKKDAALGDQLFHEKCAGCHGNRGMGSDKGPPLVHKIYEPSHHADLSFYRAVKDGVQRHHWQFGNMPPMSGIA